jgi:NADH-quinone oxidoreductase subunit N
MNWNAITPELILIVAACGLFLLGASSTLAARKFAPMLALAALLIVFFIQISKSEFGSVLTDPVGAVRVTGLGQYIKLIAAGVGAMFVLLAWPTDSQASGNSALNFGIDGAGEFFALMLLSLSGIFLVASANDIILLFLGIELASIPTYIMVSISRPLPVAQEAGVKYFFLGAMAAALMLFGFSYLYGTTGLIDLDKLAAVFAAHPADLSSWQMLGVLMLIAGIAFKIAAVPLHFYAGDVYEGAATPVTAFLSFVPKTSGFVALIKILFTISGGTWAVQPEIAKLMWVLAMLTMFAGNLLGLMQQNVKRVMAYSSVAHTGYMLVGLTALLDSRSTLALQGVLFYLAVYGIMNVAVFGVLMLLPSRRTKAATSAETYEDLAGAGRNHVGLGLAMAVGCFSLTGLPLTVGFFGKFYLAAPALRAGDVWLVVLMMINAAISAAYYLRIVGVMFLRTDSDGAALQTIHKETKDVPIQMPVVLGVAISTFATLLFGIALPATSALRSHALQAATVDSAPRPTLSETAVPTSPPLAQKP